MKKRKRKTSWWVIKMSPAGSCALLSDVVVLERPWTSTDASGFFASGTINVWKAVSVPGNHQSLPFSPVLVVPVVKVYFSPSFSAGSRILMYNPLIDSAYLPREIAELKADNFILFFFCFQIFKKCYIMNW